MIDVNSTSEYIRDHARKLTENVKGFLDYNSQTKPLIAETYQVNRRIIHKCGHDGGTMKLKFMEMHNGDCHIFNSSYEESTTYANKLCGDCLLAGSREYDNEHGFPALEGTPKQVAWAQRHRAKAHEKNPELVEPWLPVLTESAWWLDNYTRTSHAKIWKEMDEQGEAHVASIIHAYAEVREMQESKRGPSLFSL